MQELKEFDITTRAENGMRRGRTTGTCAAAAAKAAALLLERDELSTKVQVRLPDQEHFLTVPIARVAIRHDGSARADVIKEAGDDPDATDGATIFCELSRNDTGDCRFFAGTGVGTVTEPGIRVPIGEAAINPVPRQMIKQSIIDAIGSDSSFDITIGCENGIEIARKTFNPRLGIKGGISILGTTGIVEPLSMAAYIASIEVYLKVALADKPSAIAVLPGNIGLGFAGKELKLPKKRAVHISNFLGLALEYIEQALIDNSCQLNDLWILGHPGKLAKILEGQWDTHSRKSNMAMPAIGMFARRQSMPASQIQQIEGANTVEEIVHLLADTKSAFEFWTILQRELESLVAPKVPHVRNVHVKLFDMRARALDEPHCERQGEA